MLYIRFTITEILHNNYYTSCTFYLGFLNVQLYKSVNLINENSGNTDDFFNDF